MNLKKLEKKFIEKGAELEHDRWARWQAYLFSKSEWTKKGYLVPKKPCKRWQRQIDTEYSKLSEQEKESDKKEVRKYLPLIRKLITQVVESVPVEENTAGIKTTQWLRSYGMTDEDMSTAGQVEEILTNYHSDITKEIKQWKKKILEQLK